MWAANFKVQWVVGINRWPESQVMGKKVIIQPISAEFMIRFHRIMNRLIW